MKKETNKNKKINLILSFLFSCICFFSFIDIASAAGPYDLSGYAWSENIGWVNFDSGDIVNKGMNFIETGDYVQVPTIDISDTWTIEAWSFATNVADGNWNTLTRGSGGDHQIILNSSTGALGMYDNFGATGFMSAGYDGTQLANSWHHIAVTGHDNVQDFYIDGDYVGSTSVQSKTDIYSIGNYFGGGQQWGALDEVRLWNDVRTQQEIRDNMWAELNGNESGLVGYWDFNEESGSVANDKTSNNNDGTVVGGTWYSNDYGVSVGDDNILTGYAWSENIGWISFNPADLTGCPSGTCNAQLVGDKIVGWARQVNDANGWIKLGPIEVEGTDYGLNISGGNILGYAWSDTFGWISFSCTNNNECAVSDYGVSYESNSISVSNLNADVRYCEHDSSIAVNTGLSVVFSWDYASEYLQRGYTFELSTNSSFTSPFTFSLLTDSTTYTLDLSGSSWNNEKLDWGQTYYWRVMAESIEGDSSPFVESSFTIERTHASPLVKMTYFPRKIIAEIPIDFDGSTSEVYDLSEPTYYWTFIGGDPANSAESIETVIFSGTDDFLATLRVTDGDGYYCQKNSNSSNPFIPKWKIISPF